MIYGTKFGGIGTIIEVPEKVYKVLSLLQTVMEAEQSKSEQHSALMNAGYRAVKTESLRQAATNFLDGEVLEVFQNLDYKKQLYYISLMSKGGLAQISKELRSMIDFLHDKQ